MSAHPSKLFSKTILLLFTTLVIASCAASVKKVDYADARDIPEDANPAPLMFRGLDIILPPGAEIGTQSHGQFFCGPPYYPVSRLSLKIATYLEDRYIKQSFRDAMEANGYDVTGSIYKDYEREYDLMRAEYTISAKVRDIKVDLCRKLANPVISLGGGRPGEKGKMHIRVDWTVYSPLKRHVLYKISTEGYGEHDIPEEEGLALLFMNAFDMATHNLASDKQFYDLVISGLPPQRQKTKKEQRIESAPRQYDPDETVVIDKHSLSKTPFTQQVPEMLSTMVLIRTALGHGSGFFITNEGHILTNAHVVGDARRVRVVTHGNKKSLIAEVLRKDKARDVALLKLEEPYEDLKSLQTRPIRIDIPNVGEDVYAIGTPQSTRQFRDTVTKGIVSAYRKNLKVLGTRQNFIQADVDIHGGNSGGALFDGNGNLIGITVAGYGLLGLSVGLNYFIPIGEALEKLDIRFERDVNTSQPNAAHAPIQIYENTD